MIKETAKMLAFHRGRPRPSLKDYKRALEFSVKNNKARLSLGLEEIKLDFDGIPQSYREKLHV